VFAQPLEQEEHLRRVQLADLALDTYPYNSHTTGSDALWCGVPLVTRMGTTFASRVAASLLHAVGLPELVTDSADGYFMLARTLAADPERLAGIRGKLARQRLSEPLFDTERFTRNIEALYLRIWQQYEEGSRSPIVTEQ
jgi:predicted O-linked N-acetylglucosamine transferase (SPINDLY family)